MDFFDEFNQLSANEILSRLKIDVAKDDKSYVCPKCGHGKGGDGIRPRMTNKGQTRWKCFGCETDFSNYDLACAVLGLGDGGEAVKELQELYSDFLSSKCDDSPRKSARAGAKTSRSGDRMDNEKKTGAETSPKNFAGLYKHCREHYSLKEFVESCGGTWRALTFETLDEAGALFHPQYMCEDGKTCPAVILPYGDDVYFWRSTTDKGRGVPKGAKRRIYQASPITLDAPNFMVEGEIDALSVKQATKGMGIGVIATGSASFVRKTVDELNLTYGDSERKPAFVVMFDNDDKGHGNALKMVNELRAAGYPAVTFFLEGEMAGTKFKDVETGAVEEIPKVDSNDLLRRGGGALARRLIDAIEESDEKLSTLAMTLLTAKERKQRALENKSGIKDFPVAEYFSGQFWSDVASMSQYSDRCTGFDNLDGTGEFKRDGRKQLFMPGLYLLGALPGAGKTTWCWQLLNRLSKLGEPCIFCSYEMSRLELYSKSISRRLFEMKRAGRDVMALSSADIRRGAGSGIDEVNEVVSEFAKTAAKLRVLEVSNANVVALTEFLKPLIASSDKPPTVCVDYLQIIPATNSKATAKEKIDDVMLRLKDFQRETNSTLVVVSAFNRDSGKEATMQSFRESSSIEYSADVLWALQLEGNDDVTGRSLRPTLFKCLKNRNGATYDAYFNYHAAHDCFIPCTRQDLGDDA